MLEDFSEGVQTFVDNGEVSGGKVLAFRGVTPDGIRFEAVILEILRLTFSVVKLYIINWARILVKFIVFWPCHSYASILLPLPFLQPRHPISSKFEAY